MINARVPNSFKKETFYISPEGKRFQTLQAAKNWLISVIKENGNSELIHSPRQVARRNNKENQLSDEITDFKIVINEKAKQRRKQMAQKSVFRNLLKATLKRNHMKRLKTIQRKRKQPFSTLLNTRNKIARIITERKASRSIVARLQKQRREG